MTLISFSYQGRAFALNPKEIAAVESPMVGEDVRVRDTSGQLYWIDSANYEAVLDAINTALEAAQ